MNYKDYVYAIIQSMCNAAPERRIQFERAKRSVLNRGYNVKQFESTLNAYVETGVFMVDDNKRIIKAM